MKLSFALYSLTGQRLAMLDQRRTGSEVVVPQNGIRRAKVAISPYDEAVANVYPLARRLRAWLDEDCIFNGPLTAPTFNGEGDSVEINALGPNHQLEAAYVPWPTTWAPDVNGIVYTVSWSQLRQDEIMFRLMELGDITAAEIAAGIPSHGIVRGLAGTSTLRDRSYEPGKQIWSAQSELCDVIGGPDIDYEPIDDQSETGRTARLNVYDSQGVDKTDTVRFHYNTGDQNCRDFQHTPDGSGVITKFTGIGQAEQGNEPPHYTSMQPDAYKAFGKWEGFEGKPDVSESTTIEEFAQGQVAINAFPPDTVTIKPALETEAGDDKKFGMPPICGPSQDYWIGDSVEAIAKKGYWKADVKARIKQITLTETNARGLVQATIDAEPRVYGAGVT